MILLVAAINIAGATFIDRIQTVIVVILLAVFAVFIVVTLKEMDPRCWRVRPTRRRCDIISSVALTFFAFLGFAVISFTGGDLPDPKKNLPRATYLALAVTTALYVLVAIGVFGTLSVQEVIANGDTALAVAAKPSLGAGRLRDDGRRGHARDLFIGQRQHLRRRRVHQEARRDRAVPAGLRRQGSHRRDPWTGHLVRARAGPRQLRRPHRHRVLGQRRRARHLPGGRPLRRCGSAPRPSRTLPMILAAIAATAFILVVFSIQTLRDAPETFVGMIAILVLAVGLDLVWARMRTSRATALEAAAEHSKPRGD